MRSIGLEALALLAVAEAVLEVARVHDEAALGEVAREDRLTRLPVGAVELDDRRVGQVPLPGLRLAQ